MVISLSLLADAVGLALLSRAVDICALVFFLSSFLLNLFLMEKSLSFNIYSFYHLSFIFYTFLLVPSYLYYFIYRKNTVEFVPRYAYELCLI